MAVYGVAQQIADRSLVSDITKYFVDAMYHVPTQGTAPKNALESGKTTH